MLVESRTKAQYFEQTVACLLQINPAGWEGRGRDGLSWYGRAAAIAINQLVASYLNKDTLDISQSPIQPPMLATLMDRQIRDIVTAKGMREVFADLWLLKTTDCGQVDSIIEAKGLKPMSDTGELDRILDEVLAANAKSVEEYRAGKDKAFNALIGQAMKATKGKANPAAVNELLKKKLAV